MMGLQRLFFWCLMIGPGLVFAQSYPVELGQVRWLRDMDMAQYKAKKEGMPILILFQEVPGCLTCQRYGQQVLSHPLIVEAIESCFVPLAIYNNVGGTDAEVVRYFNEPSWNNPVLRVIDAKKIDVLPRFSGSCAPSEVVDYLVKALNEAEIDVPQYLLLLKSELNGNEKFATVTLGMHCFWTGEKVLGGMEGVLRTEAGFMQGQEVVNVCYNPEILSFEALLMASTQMNCADRVFTDEGSEQKVAAFALGSKRISGSETFRPDQDQKFYLSKTHYAGVPMSPMQAMKSNVLVGSGKNPNNVLSPLQIKMADYMLREPKKSFQNRIQNDAWMDAYFSLRQEIQL